MFINSFINEINKKSQIPDKKPTGIAMFHFGRVGSTVVSELLNQHLNDFCGIDSIPVKAKQIKISKKDKLNNSEQVVQNLKGTPYEWMLNT